MNAPHVDPEVFAKLVALVQRMVDAAGDPAGFDASAWTLDWINHPVPALGMACPAMYLQTTEGQKIVETLLLQIEAGAYS